MSGTQNLTTNILPVHFEADTLEVWSRNVGENENLKLLRESLSSQWSVQWQRGAVYFLPLSLDLPQPHGTSQSTLKVTEHLRLVARLTTDALVRRFSTYEPLRRKPFIFLGRKQELMSDASRVIGVQHPLLSDFRIWPKYTLDARILEVRTDFPFIGITVDLATRWEIVSDLESLQESGVDLKGLFVVRRNPDADQRSLVGRIAEIRSEVVTLSDSVGESATIDAESVMLEGRRDAFVRCLQHLLGNKYRQYEDYRDRRMGELLGGPPLFDEISRVGQILSEKPLELASGFSCTVGTPLSIQNTNSYKSVVVARQLDYCFDPARSKRHQYAWPGLETYGPFSRDTFARPNPRVLVIYPQPAQGTVEKFLRYFRDGIPGHKGFQSGFAKTFGLVNPRFDLVPVPASSQPSHQRYRNSIGDALARGELPDVALIVVEDREGDLPPADNPYLHSKAMLLMAGVATQHARLSKIASNETTLQYILQNISIALYAKMKGVPWTVDHDLTIADELVIGIGTVELSGSRLEERQRCVGITTVFRGDGNYLLGQLTREATYTEYPQVLRDSTRDLIEEMRRRNGWQLGDTVRIVLHAARPPKNVDFGLLMRDAIAAVGDDQHIEFAFVTVSHDHPFALFDTSQLGKQSGRSQKGVFAPDRGLIVQTDKYSRLITTTGVTLVKRAGLPLPRPLQIHLHRHSTFTDLHYLSEQVLKFTSLSWRSTQPSADPVTIYYSELIARHLARLKAIPDWSPSLLDTRLRTSKWFL
jgi:hypothetical protein